MASSLVGVCRERIALGPFGIREGDELEIHYPISDDVRMVIPRFVRQRFTVAGMRDLVAQPLTLEEFLLNPFHRYGRWLITASNHSVYYLGCSLEFRAPSQLRIGAYEEGSKRPSKIFYRGFESTANDRMKLRTLANALSARVDLRIFADDLKLKACDCKRPTKEQEQQIEQPK
ncbi:MAG: hypothetical protein U0930_03510 [Pirellulales bacterium]